MKKVLDILKPPFRYDPEGQQIFDSNNNLVLDVRAWGKLQNYENGEKLQDDFGKFTVDRLNGILLIG